jgi:hypothetical protein
MSMSVSIYMSICVSVSIVMSMSMPMPGIYLYTGWGAQSWTKTFFFQYIGLHVILKLILGLEKYCFVWAGPLANHPFNFNFIFLSDGLTHGKLEMGVRCTSAGGSTR